MFDPTANSTKKLIEKYKALYELAIKQQAHTDLTLDQVKAIGKRVLNECMKTVMNELKIPQEDRASIIEQFEELIRQECPDITFDTPLKFDKNGFSENK
jgi:F0F1-type ATP synthase delta subunit